MDLIKFLLRIATQFNALDSNDRLKIEEEAYQWKEQFLKKENAFSKFYKEHLEAWYTKLFLSLFFLFAVRQISSWMNPEPIDDEDFD
ncbi:hypothetical protein QWY31_00535 [Cytophagales bacterium LB-30]|uniref:Uncharacterized protein n=1 Tax=Shiella aurantiaca TaxID=3058365 RepID=A0ABT8F0J2_9BACT|nr:hypothetical protein [Shiella aurantiaca]MDN4163962.1 hypothetical protein [Shiella aurantiaca]